MSPIKTSFAMFLRQILSDSMLVIVCLSSLLAAFFFRFAVPAIETLLCSYLQVNQVLSPYYLLFDLLLNMLTPFMFCFASAMVMLEEYDVNLSSYLSVTPLEKKGYLVSRLLLPSLGAYGVSLVLLSNFSLTVWNPITLAGITLLSCFSAILEAMVVFTYSRNKVEGMALAKLSGLLMLGLPIPFFVQTNFRFLFSPLPSFWVSSYALTENLSFLLPGLLLSVLYVGGIYRKFKVKVA
jgi:fluoroquinolone transport system permease protein